jgi:hypothetical protein
MVERTLKLISFIIPAQEIENHLLISQVCLNKNQPSKSWIEIYNPADKALTLERFRLSNLRTINVLPDSINKKGGMKVGAGDYVILCADENQFRLSNKKPVKLVKVRALARIASGGFLAITTKGADITKSEVVRYGKKEWSAKIEKIAGEQAVGFSEEGNSYTRKIEKNGTGIIVSDFTESDLTR